MGVSIVIPSYNIQQEYIEQCMMSIYNQTYNDWEVIIIDDGSKEEYACYLDKYANDNIRIYHQKNAGVATSRNRGVEYAKKEWVFFLDPDDWMENTELEKLIKIAEGKNADMVSANAFFFKNGSTEKGPERYKGCIILEGRDGVDKYIAELLSPGNSNVKYRKSLGGFARTPWAKLYRKSIIDENHVIFPEGIHPNEDTYFNLMYAFHCGKIIILNECLHYYRISNCGVTSTYKDTWINNNNRVKYVTRELLEEHDCFDKYKKEWGNYSLLLLKDIFRLQLFNPHNQSDLKDRKIAAKKLIDEDKDYSNAIRNTNNYLYNFRSKVFAILVRFHLYFVINILYGKK